MHIWIQNSPSQYRQAYCYSCEHVLKHSSLFQCKHEFFHILLTISTIAARQRKNGYLCLYLWIKSERSNTHCFYTVLSAIPTLQLAQTLLDKWMNDWSPPLFFRKFSSLFMFHYRESKTNTLIFITIHTRTHGLSKFPARLSVKDLSQELPKMCWREIEVMKHLVQILHRHHLASVLHETEMTILVPQ